MNQHHDNLKGVMVVCAVAALSATGQGCVRQGFPAEERDSRPPTGADVWLDAADDVSRDRATKDVVHDVPAPDQVTLDAPLPDQAPDTKATADLKQPTPDAKVIPDKTVIPDVKVDGGSKPPTHAWSKGFGGTNTDWPADVAVDGSGNIFLTGRFQNSINFGGATLSGKGKHDVFVASFTPAGKHRWSRSFGTADTDYGWSVATDSSGNVYLSGQFLGTTNFGGGAVTSKWSDCFVASFDSNGKYRWAKHFGGSQHDSGYAVAVDGANNIYLTGYYTSLAGFGAANLPNAKNQSPYVASFDSTGKHRWSKGFPAAIHGVGVDLAADNAGRIYVTGRYSGSVNLGGSLHSSKGATDIFVTSFDSTGKHRWSKGFGSASTDYAEGVDVDSAGNVYLTGSAQGALNFGGGPLANKGSWDIYLASFDSTGKHRWSKGIGGVSADMGYGVAVDKAGNLHLTGSFMSALDLGGGPLVSKGSSDLYVASYTSLGKHRWSRRLGGPKGETGKGVAVDASGGIYVTGYFLGTTPLGGAPISSNGGFDIFLMKLTP